ncbi:hypothetical protein TRFO_04289 [Tritrichomonas foetus]|uniref:Palmitoyltransferase n=1 Tax=Tritrichomonas foetus TaxID=1144522 RepID=A0A1J4KLL5_9EUKA|nr:hypothetical protein TRFO_04289 [Tritrichomonas foetus]|eukprot:OHT10269.1 hypothetical protein TRFO_04289 [Tritrichomonas foetus]
MKNEIYEVTRKISYVPSMNTIFIGDCMVNITKFLSLIILIFYESYIFLTEFNLNAEKYQSICFYSYILFLALFLLSLSMIYIEGPGYLPFFYGDPDNCQKKNKLGIALTKDDINYAKNHQLGPNAIFIFSEKRFVLRPNCRDKLTGVFIGRRNMKFFVQSRIYLFFLIHIFGISFFQSLNKIVFIYGFDFIFWVYILNLIFFLAYAYISMTNIVELINKLMFNITYLELILLNDEFSNCFGSKIKCLKEFFGKDIKMWFLPTPSFGSVSDEYLYISSRTSSL